MSSILQLNTMTTISPSLKLILNLSKAHVILSRRLETRLSGHGIGYTDFAILLILHEAPGQKLRRVDLAEKIGFTASGVTRMLIPLEKIGLVQREAYERDARVSYVGLTDTGRQIFEEALASAEGIAQDIFSTDTITTAKAKKLDAFSDMITELGGNII
ncbi:MarR family transcriptional regulator [Chitinophaga sp.]|uniref:MarR family winged helix-turn-helix transcriptional regulator n=1 Tax=Chitinophaga sp. TaxID=1869181 RepID=UPI0031DA82CD